jgi:hypothetical protein
MKPAIALSAIGMMLATAATAKAALAVLSGPAPVSPTRATVILKDRPFVSPALPAVKAKGALERKVALAAFVGTQA